MQYVHLLPVASLLPLLESGSLVAVGVGSDGVAYFVMALKPLDYRFAKVGASFSKTVTEERQQYRVVGMFGSKTILDVMIEEEPFNIHHIQPLSGELLLVCARSRYRGPEDFEKNGRVYNLDGKFVREMLLGDGIQSVQATAGGTIWTSYFDEGVFGNYGWKSPIGASGLVAWDSSGNKLYEFEPNDGLDLISDCYALNVVAEEDVWLCYYTEFPLVHLHRRQIESVWTPPVAGSGAFAIAENRALFQGGYDDHDTYHLFELGRDGEPNLLAKLELKDKNGQRIVADRIVGRGDALYVLAAGLLYRVDVQTVLAQLGQG